MGSPMPVLRPSIALTLALIVVADIFSIQERGRFQGLFGVVWGLAGVSGPLLGGLIVHRAGRVPEVGATVSLDGYDLIVREADETRVVKVEIVRAEPGLVPPAEATSP